MNLDTVQTENTYMSADQFEMIVKALQLVNSNVKKDDALRNIVDVAVNLTNADRGTLYLVENDEIWSKVLIGDEIEEIRLKVGEGIAGWVAENGEILNIDDVTIDERFDGSFDKATGYVTKNMLVYPIKNKINETVGVLQLLNSLKGGFTKQEEAFLNAISLNVAVALENTALVEQLLTTERDMSIGKMGNFLSNDLRKPILTCLRYAEHLTKKDLSFDVKQVVTLLVEQLKQVSNQVISASDFTEGTTLLRRQPICLSDTLQEFNINIHSLIKTHNCKIEHELNDDVIVNVDKKEFYQCYYNIIKNSCEALPEGGNILISTVKQNDFVEIYFIDRGIGIEKSDLKQVFNPLWTKNKKNNSGLGLSISKKIVEDHKGRISIKSEKDSGTTVIISLPIH
jgi:K+-sensing histidine kinase KdpD